MDYLKLRHPVTKDLINFRSLDIQELLELEALCQEAKVTTGLKVESIQDSGQEAPRSMTDFIKYCGLIILMSQKYRNIRIYEDARLQVKVYRKLLTEFVTDPYLQVLLKAREEELLGQLTAVR